MESLFARSTPRRGRVCLMLGASLLLHSGIVGVAGLWTPPEPPEHTVIIDDIFETPGGGGLMPYHPAETPERMPLESPQTPPPEQIEPTVPTPPASSDEIEMTEPAKQTSPSRTVVNSRSLPANRPTNTQSSSRVSAGLPGPAAPGSATAAGPASIAGAWVMPHPPYPQTQLASRGGVTGATTVRITTDASGRVSNVVIVRSTGNPALDSHTETYVRMNWHGPSNASRTTEFVYQIR